MSIEIRNRQLQELIGLTCLSCGGFNVRESTPDFEGSQDVVTMSECTCQGLNRRFWRLAKKCVRCLGTGKRSYSPHGFDYYSTQHALEIVEELFAGSYGRVIATCYGCLGGGIVSETYLIGGLVEHIADMDFQVRPVKRSGYWTISLYQHGYDKSWGDGGEGDTLEEALIDTLDILTKADV